MAFYDMVIDRDIGKWIPRVKFRLVVAGDATVATAGTFSAL
jgi:hypothetical protein